MKIPKTTHNIEFAACQKGEVFYDFVSRELSRKSDRRVKSMVDITRYVEEARKTYNYPTDAYGTDRLDRWNNTLKEYNLFTDFIPAEWMKAFKQAYQDVKQKLLLKAKFAPDALKDSAMIVIIWEVPRLEEVAPDWDPANVGKIQPHTYRLPKHIPDGVISGKGRDGSIPLSYENYTALSMVAQTHKARLVSDSEPEDDPSYYLVPSGPDCVMSRTEMRAYLDSQYILPIYGMEGAWMDARQIKPLSMKPVYTGITRTQLEYMLTNYEERHDCSST